MGGKLLIQQDGTTERIKEIAIFDDPQKLKMILNHLTWKILVMLSEEQMYPLEIARRIGIHEQKVYYHIRKLVKAGVIRVSREEEKKGATAKYYTPISQAFGIEFPQDYRLVRRSMSPDLNGQLEKFFKEFISEEGSLDGKVVVGSPMPHGPFKTSARDGHYAAHLTFFLGQFVKMPQDFPIKLDVDVKAEKEEGSNLILVGGPGTNLLAQEVNESLQIKFNMQPSDKGFLLGGLMSKKTSQIYTADAVGVISKIINPWNRTKRVLVLAGNKAVGTKACVLALTNFWEKTLKTFEGGDDFVCIVQGFDLDGDGKVDSVEILE